MRLAAEADLGSETQIGISVRDLEEADAERENLPLPEGAVIDEVRSQGPAAEAGFEVGDVVIEFDGERVRSARQLARLVQETPRGRTVGVVVMRSAARVELDVTPETRSVVSILGDRRPFHGRRNFSFTLPEIDIPRFDLDIWARPRLGVRVEEVGPQLAEYLGVEQGVFVMHVNEDSPAAEAGLRAGDVITAVDEGTISQVSGLRRRLSRVDPGEEFELVVVRNKEELTLRVTLDEEDVERRRLRHWRRPV